MGFDYTLDTESENLAMNHNVQHPTQTPNPKGNVMQSRSERLTQSEQQNVSLAASPQVVERQPPSMPSQPYSQPLPEVHSDNMQVQSTYSQPNAHQAGFAMSPHAPSQIPAARATFVSNPQQSYPQQMTPQQTLGNPSDAAAGTHPEAPSSAHGLKSSLQSLGKRLISPHHGSQTSADQPNIGFLPTPALVKKHQEDKGPSIGSPRPLYQFQVTKLRSWRTGYVRLLCLYQDKFVTIDPDSHEVTNTWPFAILSDWLAIPTEKDTILLQVNADKLKFKCHNVPRERVLTAMLECKHHAEMEEQQPHEYPTFRQCSRQTRHGTRVDMSLQVAPHGLLELHPGTGALLQTYRYVDIGAVSFTADDSMGIVLHFSTNDNKSRLFFIQSSRRHGNGRSDLLTIMREQYETLGLELNVSESCTVASWMERRRALGKTAGPIVSIWGVTKTAKRHDASVVGADHGWLGGIVPRRLALTGKGYLLEMDAGGVVSCRSLKDLHGLVRPPNSDSLTLEYTGGAQQTYSSSNRDALLVSLLDAASSLAFNAKVDVSDVTSAGYSLSSLSDTSDAAPIVPGAAAIFQPISVPIHCLKRVHAVSTAAYAYMCLGKESFQDSSTNMDFVEECRLVVEACREFNASVPPSGDGLPTGPNDKTVLGCVGSLWGIVSNLLGLHGLQGSDSTDSRDRQRSESAASPLLQSLYRLSQTPAGYRGSAELSTLQDALATFWGVSDSFCKYWALRNLSVLLAGCEKRDLEIEFVNKSVILKSGGQAMVDGLVHAMLHAGSFQADGQKLVSDLLLMVSSDILQGIMCSYHDTTSPEHFSAFINALAKGYRALLSALRSDTPFVIENTALLLHLLSTHSPETSSAIREAASTSGILLQHFHAAIFSPLEGQRFLSRYLCSLWLLGPMRCDEKRLLRRMVPSGFLPFLNMPILSSMEEDQLDELERASFQGNGKLIANGGTSDPPAETSLSDLSVGSGGAGTNTKRLRSRIQLARQTMQSHPDRAKPENFRIFFHVLTKDHSLADLIWNQHTRQELRVALENEIQSIRRMTESRGGIDRMAWNHQQFAVAYPSLDTEVKVGTVYMRLWLQAGDGFIRSWEDPGQLFELLFRRFLCELDRNPMVTNMCVRCLERLYAIHAKVIGPFSDAMILVRSVASTRNIETQHRLLGLLAVLLGVAEDDDCSESANIPENAEQLLNMESIGLLCQFVAWVHTSTENFGNLLTSLLQSSDRTRPKITYGTDTKPQQDCGQSLDQQASQTVVGVVELPAVWYVSSSGRVPPSPESIRGPYRVSDLMKMVESGSLSEYDQVTASHVEDYSAEDDSSQPADSHIDTGKWRRLREVWQLRWQLCTGNSHGIFKPHDVALLALRSLTRLVDIHRSLDSRGVPFFPVPIAKRLLCGLSYDLPALLTNESSITLDQRDCLPIISQAILSSDNRVVDAAADLLLKLMSHNDEAVSKFYLTGIFFFCCCYPGSNFRSLARLLHATHLRQHFRSGFAAAADDSEISLNQRSILGNMLPEGLLRVLVNYGPERFEQIFIGNYDTPEVIWNNLDMRPHLIEMIRQHIGDFPRRLSQHTTASYEYCPIPGIAYKRLKREIFCHNYYLNNLCDEARFPDWPIAEPVEVFRACLDNWKLEMERDEVVEEDAQEEARKVLDLKAGDGGKELRKAYRSLARRYHPDKNPAGREMFEAIQSAYELLLPIVESGGTIATAPESLDTTEILDADNATEGLGGGVSQMHTIHLLIKTQLLICKRHPKEMSVYKFPAFSMLFSCLRVPKSCIELADCSASSSPEDYCLARVPRAAFVLTAVELLFQTCLVSPMNAEELVCEGGLPVLDELLHVYTIIIYLLCDETKKQDATSQIVDSKTVLLILSQIVHTISGVAFYESGREAIVSLKDPVRFCINWRRSLVGVFDGAVCGTESIVTLKKHALEGLANMSKDAKLQNLMIGCGVVWPLVRSLLGYDPSLDSNLTVHENEEELSLSQATSNILARLAARALGMLSGAMKDKTLSTPFNSILAEALDKLLTPPVAKMLRNRQSSELLRTLNTNVETPTRIWTKAMREELERFVDTVESDRPDGTYNTMEMELNPALSFEYSTLKEEVMIGGVYVRVFNGMANSREAIRDIPDSTAFAVSVIGYVAKCLNYNSRELDGWKDVPVPLANSNGGPLPVSMNDARFQMAIRALENLTKMDGLMDEVLNENADVPAILISLLEVSESSESSDICRNILAILSPKQSFADSIAEQRVLWRLLALLERAQHTNQDTTLEQKEGAKSSQRNWSLLDSLCSSSSIAVQMVHSSAWLELLGIIAGYSKFTKALNSRLGAARTLARLLWDSETGPFLGPVMERFLPLSLIVVLKEKGAEEMMKLFDGECENPELIWSAEMRSELRSAIGNLLDDILEARNGGEGLKDFQLPPTTRANYRALDGEPYIGGVYVRLFLKEPTHHLRDPTDFLSKLLIQWTEEVERAVSSIDKARDSLSGASSSPSHSLVQSKEDSLETITSAIVYLCKVQESLCDKLAQWGYMARAISLLDDVLANDLVGAPQTSIMRVLHVAANRMTNVEALALCGSTGGKGGVVDIVMKAIGTGTLHTDTSFMVEVLKKVFTKALGDVHSPGRTDLCAPGNGETQSNGSFGAQQSGPNKVVQAQSDAASFYAMAPSPAPGLDPVGKKREKVTFDNPLDNPLAFVPGPEPVGAPASSTSSQPHHPPPTGMSASVPEVPVDRGASTATYGQSMSSQNRGNAAQEQRYGLSGQQPANPMVSAPAPSTRLQTRFSPVAPPAQAPWSGQQGGERQIANSANWTHQAQMSPIPLQQNVSVVPSQRSTQQRAPQQASFGGQPQPTWISSPSVPPHHHSVQGSSTAHTTSLPQDSGLTNQQQQRQQQVSSYGYGQPQQPAFSHGGPQQHHAPQYFQQQMPQQQGLQQHQQQVHQFTGAPSTETHSPAQTKTQVQQMHESATNHVGMQQPQPSFSPVPSTQVRERSPVTTLSQAGIETAPAPQQAPPPEPSQYSYGPKPVEGSGIDARSAPDPKQVAELQTMSTPGAPGSAQGRVSLLESALACKLPQFLLEDVLENPTLPQVRDAASAKVHCVDLLKVLTMDPGYGPKFSLILDALPAWSKYKSQDHSLFITGSQQKADYYLTGGGESAKLLTDK